MDFGCNPNINKNLLLRLDLCFENGTLVASRIGWTESRMATEMLQGDDDDLD